MEVINIKGTDDTPSVTMDKDNGIFLIQGRSLPEDVTLFYQPILDWITEYGGINQFDGSVEFRYKDSDGKVIFAIITNKEGSADTVVEYEYVNNKKVRMTYTNTFAQTLTIYNQNMNLTTSIDIDSNGNILSVTSEITLT